jgi:hypothetical protein
MPDVNVKAKVDLNKFVEQARSGIGELLHGAAVRSSVIYNNSKAPVTFYVYNYIDIVYLVSAQKALVAPGYYGVVAASGEFYKIHPNDKKEQEFLVAPGRAYVYNGPGQIESV